MKKGIKSPYIINSIYEQHRLLALPKPLHPLISVFNFADIKETSAELSNSFVLNFYCVAIKKNFKGKLKYGQNYYDFDEGVMSFISPNQVLSNTAGEKATEGCCLVFHSDFLANYPLGKTIKNYGFFSYALNEALHLSEQEEETITAILQNIKREYSSPIDAFSQNVMISHIELLLSYSNRFYNRQFITRKNANDDLLTTLEELLTDYFNSEKVREFGLPTVKYISEKLNISPNYLSDMLRSLTGQSTQQHIHDKVIEKAKEILTTTSFSVGEIAYKLGFEYPQSFNKLFKHKTEVSPLEYRNSFN